MKSTRYILLAYGLLAFYCARAQVDCSDALVRANALYENGKLQDAIVQLEGCSSTLKSAEQRFEANRLLALCYLYKNDIETAHLHIEKMLKLRPDYARYTIGKDPGQLSKVITAYKVEPVLSMRVFSGPGIQSPKIKSNYNPYPQGNSKYHNTLGYSLGFEGVWTLKNALELNTSVYLQGGSIEHHITEVDQISLLYREMYSLPSIAVGIKYRYRFGPKWSVIAGPHLGYGYLIDDYMLVTHQNIVSDELVQYSSDGLNNRDRNQYFGGLSVSINRKMLSGSLGIRWQYDHFWKTLLSADSRLNDLEFAINSLYFNDLVKLRAHHFQLTYSFPLKYRIERE